ncbi:hypothetical protein MMC25_007776 [Agyrium rufum]|nr:hypothetical protein [Agyrium rufum]
MAETLERFFGPSTPKEQWEDHYGQRTWYKYTAVGGKLPRRLVVQPHSADSRHLRDTTSDSITFTYSSTEYPHRLRVTYRWVGGVYLRNVNTAEDPRDHYRVYWTDSDYGKSPRCMQVYDGLAVSGTIIGDLTMTDPNNGVPAPWSDRANVLFYERVNVEGYAGVKQTINRFFGDLGDRLDSDGHRQTNDDEHVSASSIVDETRITAPNQAVNGEIVALDSDDEEAAPNEGDHDNGHETNTGTEDLSQPPNNKRRAESEHPNAPPSKSQKGKGREQIDLTGAVASTSQSVATPYSTYVTQEQTQSPVSCGTTQTTDSKTSPESCASGSPRGNGHQKYRSSSGKVVVDSTSSTASEDKASTTNQTNANDDEEEPHQVLLDAPCENEHPQGNPVWLTATSKTLGTSPSEIADSQDPTAAQGQGRED